MDTSSMMQGEKESEQEKTNGNQTEFRYETPLTRHSK